MSEVKLSKREEKALEIRKVALIKTATKKFMWITLFISWFSLSMAVGYFGTFLLLK